MEYTTLSHIDRSQVLAAIQKHATYHEIHDVIAYKLQSKKMQFSIKYTTLMHIDPSQV